MRRGGSKAHSEGEDRWTVRGFENGHPKYALHVYPGMERSDGWPSDGKSWRGRLLNVNKRCKRLEETDEQTSNDVNEKGEGSRGEPEQAETNMGKEAERNATG